MQKSLDSLKVFRGGVELLLKKQLKGSKVGGLNEQRENRSGHQSFCRYADTNNKNIYSINRVIVFDVGRMLLHGVRKAGHYPFGCVWDYRELDNHRLYNAIWAKAIASSPSCRRSRNINNVLSRHGADKRTSPCYISEHICVRSYLLCDGIIPERGCA